MAAAPHTLLFVGDSITDAGRDRADAGSLGDGYVRLVADELAAREAAPARPQAPGGAPTPAGAGVVAVGIVNAGISGNRAVDLERRWADDVAPHDVDVLTVFVGVNDMWRRFDQDDPTSAEAFEATYRRLLATDAGAARVILMEPFFLPARDDQRAWLDDLDPKRDVVRRLAAEAGAALVPLHEVMSAAAAAEGVAAIAPDGVHPTPRGSRLIADAWLAAYDTSAT